MLIIPGAYGGWGNAPAATPPEVEALPPAPLSITITEPSTTQYSPTYLVRATGTAGGTVVIDATAGGEVFQSYPATEVSPGVYEATIDFGGGDLVATITNAQNETAQSAVVTVLCQAPPEPVMEDPTEGAVLAAASYVFRATALPGATLMFYNQISGLEYAATEASPGVYEAEVGLVLGANAVTVSVYFDPALFSYIVVNVTYDNAV